MRTAQRLAELEAIRDRELTESEQTEALYLAWRDRENQRRKQRYWSDPAFRQATIDRAVANKRARGWK